MPVYYNLGLIFIVLDMTSIISGNIALTKVFAEKLEDSDIIAILSDAARNTSGQTISLVKNELSISIFKPT